MRCSTEHFYAFGTQSVQEEDEDNALDCFLSEVREFNQEYDLIGSGKKARDEKKAKELEELLKQEKQVLAGEEHDDRVRFTCIQDS